MQQSTTGIPSRFPVSTRREVRARSSRLGSGAPCVPAGVITSVDDLALHRSFRAVKPPENTPDVTDWAADDH